MKDLAHNDVILFSRKVNLKKAAENKALYFEKSGAQGVLSLLSR